MKKILFKILFVILVTAFLVLPRRAFAETPEDTGKGGGRRGGIVLVLSGGGTKGFAHVGVLKVLERERIPVAGIVGVSIGSVIGGLYACGYSADEIQGIISGTNVMGLIADSGTRAKSDVGDHRPMGENVRLSHVNLDKRFKINGPLGILPALSLVSFLTKHTGHLQTTDFNDLPIPFACVATDLETGDEVVLRGGSLASSIRASASIPGLMEPWPIDGRLLVDGGLVANVPVEIAKRLFPGYPVVAVNLAGESISKPRERFKSMIDVMIQTIDIMTIDRIKANEALADLMIYPDVASYGILEDSGYDEIFKRGQRAADEHVGRLIALSKYSPIPPEDKPAPPAMRMVRGVRVEGLNAGLTDDLEKRYSVWIGKPLDSNAVNEARDNIAKLDEVASVSVETYPANSADSGGGNVEVLFSVDKRPAFELAVDGYTASFHPRRWVALNLNARDALRDGDSANIGVWLGNDELGAEARYFTPMRRGGQWGFSLSWSDEDLEYAGDARYSVERYSARIMRYWDNMNDFRIGFGVAGEYADAPGYGKFSWGPYLYFNKDTLDNLLIPSRGYSLNARLWYNNDVFVSRSTLTAYLPLRSNLRFLLHLGMETGKRGSAPYSAALGDSEEMIGLSRHPIAGDQTIWARAGIGRDFHNAWWGAVRGELFATYGVILDSWNIDKSVWEAGAALSFPGQFLNGRVVLVYNSENEFVFGFSLGNPSRNASPLP